MPRHLPTQSEGRAIVMTGVEGGGVTLYGRETTDGWEYRVDYADQTPLMPPWALSILKYAVWHLPIVP